MTNSKLYLHYQKKHQNNKITKIKTIKNKLKVNKLNWKKTHTFTDEEKRREVQRRGEKRREEKRSGAGRRRKNEAKRRGLELIGQFYRWNHRRN